MSEEKREKGRRAVLKPAWISELLKQLMQLQDNKHVEKRANQAMDRIFPHLRQLTFNDDGNASWEPPTETVEFFFPDSEMFAVRRAFIQAYGGTRGREPATIGAKRFLLDKICKELGILKRVRAAVEREDTSEDFSMEYDEEDTLEEGDEVDLDEGRDEQPQGNGEAKKAEEPAATEKS